MIILSTGTVKKIQFNSEKGCEAARKHVILEAAIPKLQSAKCINDPKQK
jgi:hypothetical protein